MKEDGLILRYIGSSFHCGLSEVFLHHLYLATKTRQKDYMQPQSQRRNYDLWQAPDQATESRHQ